MQLTRIALWILSGALAAVLAEGQEPVLPGSLTYPEDIGAARLERDREARRAAARDDGPFHGFRFTDRLAESGIGFVHRIVDDAGKHYKAVHYDHGNGVAVADVDGDGRLDLYFTTQLGRNELWKNSGGGRFEDVTAAAGVALAERVGVTASFGDVDNDGDPDLFATTVRMGNALFENDGQGVFRDVTARAGLDYSGHSSGAVFFDYDRDGFLDLFLTNVGVYTTGERGRGGYWVGFEKDAFRGHLFRQRTETSILYRNRGDGTFEDVSRQVNLVDRGWSGDAAFSDLDGNGYPDLYVLNMQGDDHYYENVGGQIFLEKRAQHFRKSPWGAMGIKFFDQDNDGLMDLLLTDMHSDMSVEVGPEKEREKSDMQWDEQFLAGGGDNIFGNAFFRNLGEGKFEEISDVVGAENYWPWGVSVGDLNADGFDDVFITASMNYPFRYGINSVLLNDRGRTFVASEFRLGVEPRTGGLTVPWFDLDCSGADQDHDRCEGREGRWTVHGARGTRSSVIFDLEGDGDLDIVTNEFGTGPMVLTSDLSQRRELRYLEVTLVGSRSNRDGLGARVELTTGGGTQTKVHDGSSGYLSHSLLPLYFGLTGQGEIERLVVRWPSGQVQILPGPIDANRRLEVIEPSAEPASEQAN